MCCAVFCPSYFSLWPGQTTTTDWKIDTRVVGEGPTASNEKINRTAIACEIKFKSLDGGETEAIAVVTGPEGSQIGCKCQVERKVKPLVEVTFEPGNANGIRVENTNDDGLWRFRKDEKRGYKVSMLDRRCYAQRKGITEGMYFPTVDDQPYTPDLFKKKNEGSSAFRVALSRVATRKEEGGKSLYGPDGKQFEIKFQPVLPDNVKIDIEYDLLPVSNADLLLDGTLRSLPLLRSTAELQTMYREQIGPIHFAPYLGEGVTTHKPGWPNTLLDLGFTEVERTSDADGNEK